MCHLKPPQCSSRMWKTWKFWWNFLAKSLYFSHYPSFSPFERPDAYKCYTFSESYGSRETRDIKSSTSKFDIEAGGILSSLWTQTGPWSDTASYALFKIVQKCVDLSFFWTNLMSVSIPLNKVPFAKFPERERDLLNKFGRSQVLQISTSNQTKHIHSYSPTIE